LWSSRGDRDLADIGGDVREILALYDWLLWFGQRLRGCFKVGGKREVTEVIWPVEDDESESEGFWWKCLLPMRLMAGVGWGLFVRALACNTVARKGWQREFAEVE
jgi:hypothetical protein